MSAQVFVQELLAENPYMTELEAAKALRQAGFSIEEAESALKVNGFDVKAGDRPGGKSIFSCYGWVDWPSAEPAVEKTMLSEDLCEKALTVLQTDPAAADILQWLQDRRIEGGYCSALLAHWRLLGGRTLAECIIAGEYDEVKATLEAFSSGVYI